MNLLGYQGEKGVWDELEVRTDPCTLLCIEQMTSGNPLCSTGSCSVVCGDLRGRETEKADPCVRVPDSLRCSGDSQAIVRQLSSTENKAATALAQKPKLSLSTAWPPEKLLTLLSYRLLN